MNHDSIELSDPFKLIDSYHVEQMFNIGRTELLVWIRKYKFPPPIKLNGEELFNFNEVTNWGREQKNERRLIFSNRLCIVFHKELPVIPLLIL